MDSPSITSVPELSLWARNYLLISFFFTFICDLDLVGRFVVNALVFNLTYAKWIRGQLPACGLGEQSHVGNWRAGFNSLNFVASVWEVNQEMEGLSLSLTHSVNLPF